MRSHVKIECMGKLYKIGSYVLIRIIFWIQFSSFLLDFLLEIIWNLCPSVQKGWINSWSIELSILDCSAVVVWCLMALIVDFRREAWQITLAVGRARHLTRRASFAPRSTCYYSAWRADVNCFMVSVPSPPQTDKSKHQYFDVFRYRVLIKYCVNHCDFS